MLQDEKDVELQTFVVPTHSQELPRNQAKKTFKKRTPSRVKSVSLSMVLYGPMDLFEATGEFFEQCSEFLQSPLHCDRNLPYRNPQSLSGNDHNAPMTYQLEAELCHSQIETVVQSPDPSSALEAEDVLQETQAPPSVRSSLYE